MSQHIWYTIDWLGTQKYRKLVRVSRSWVSLSLLTSPQASCESSNHKGGWVWVFSWYQMIGFSNNYSVPNSQGEDHWKMTSDTISVVLLPMPQVSYQDCPVFRCQPCVLVFHASDQETESWAFHDPNSMLKYSIESVAKLRKPLTHCPHIKVQDKIRNSEMEEVFRAREEWRWAGLPCPPEQNTLTSGPFASPLQALFREGNGIPLQYSFLENPMDRGAW